MLVGLGLIFVLIIVLLICAKEVKPIVREEVGYISLIHDTFFGMKNRFHNPVLKAIFKIYGYIGVIAILVVLPLSIICYHPVSDTEVILKQPFYRAGTVVAVKTGKGYEEKMITKDSYNYFPTLTVDGKEVKRRKVLGVIKTRENKFDGYLDSIKASFESSRLISMKNSGKYEDKY
jgi:hypothetical protein